MRERTENQGKVRRSPSMTRVTNVVKRILGPERYAKFIRSLPQDTLLEIMSSDKPDHKFGEYILGRYIGEYRKDGTDRNSVIVNALIECMRGLGLEDEIQSISEKRERSPRRNSLLYKMYQMLDRIDEMRRTPDPRVFMENLNYLEEILKEQKRRLENVSRRTPKQLGVS